MLGDFGPEGDNYLLFSVYERWSHSEQKDSVKNIGSVAEIPKSVGSK